MKKIILFLALAICFSSCKKDEVTSFIGSLRLDSTNFSAPPFPSGTHRAAVKFTNTELDEYVGNDLAELEFYLVEIPSTVEVRVYTEGDTEEEPGALVYQKDVTDDVEANSWNRHHFDTPVAITGEDLWLCIRVTNSGELPSIGCDPGPAVDGGDWYYNVSTGWESFRDNTNGDVSINWNIRGWVTE